MKHELEGRLLAVAAEVREGAYLADVGTDHAYLPIYLMQKGRLCHAVASDIRRGPLSRADENIRGAGLSEKIETLLTDGLHGIERHPVTDIVIAGMGGQMIAAILENAPFVRQRPVRLILQPMQNIPELRSYLANGYRIERETLVAEEKKLYTVLTVTYDGIKRETTPLSLLLGDYTIAHRHEMPLFSELCRRHLAVLSEKLEGRRKGGHDTSAEESLSSEIQALLTKP